MKKEVKKPEKIALCRECHGTGKVSVGRFVKKAETCPNALAAAGWS